MAQRSLDKPKTQLLGNGYETAKHHLNPSWGTAKNSTFGGVQNSTFGTPLGEEKSPIRRPKTWRNLAWTSARMQLLRNSQTPPKSELWYSKKQYIRRAQNGTFGTP